MFNGFTYILLIAKSFQLVEFLHMKHTRQETVEVAQFRLRPLHLAQRGKTWQQLPFHFFFVCHPLCPYAAFGANDVLLLLRREFLEARIKVVDALNARYALYLVDARIGEIKVGYRGHYGLVAFSCGAYAGFLAGPAYHGDIL